MKADEIIEQIISRHENKDDSPIELYEKLYKEYCITVSSILIMQVLLS